MKEMNMNKIELSADILIRLYTTILRIRKVQLWDNCFR